MMAQFFRGIPRSILDAARIDGASALRVRLLQGELRRLMNTFVGLRERGYAPPDLFRAASRRGDVLNQPDTLQLTNDSKTLVVGAGGGGLACRTYRRA